MDRKLETLDLITAASFIVFVLFSTFSISVAQLSGAMGGMAWLAKTYLTRSWGRLRWPMGRPFLSFVLACLLAVVTAVDTGRSFNSLRKLLEILIFFWTVNCASDAKPAVLFDWLAGLRPLAFLRDFLVRMGSSLKTIPPPEFLAVLLLLSAWLAAFYGIFQALTAGVSVSTRVSGSLSIYMTFAGVLMLAGLMALSRALFGASREIWPAAALGFIVVCLFFTLTRQAWLGFVAGTAFLVFIRKKIFLMVLPALIVLAFVFSKGAVSERLQSFGNLKDQTFLTRLELWRGGWEIFKDHPLTGCGFKCVDTVYREYPRYAEVLKKYKGMHNNLIQLAVDTGLAGTIAWISIWIGYFALLYRLRGAFGPDEPSRWVYLGSAAAILGLLAGGMFEVNFYDSEVIMLAYFLMALPFASPPGKDRLFAEDR